MTRPDPWLVLKYWRDVLGAPVHLSDGREVPMRQLWEEFYAKEENLRPWIELFNPPNFLDYSG